MSTAVRTYRSAPAEPRERGVAFGTAHARQIAANVAAYGRLFARAAGGAPFDVAAHGSAALDAIAAYAPSLRAEIDGIAEGAAIAVEQIGAINARTELLACARRAALAAPAPGGAPGAPGGATGLPIRGECSTAVRVATDDRAPLAVQTWDWYAELADGWFVWEIEHLDGRRTTTLTEYGIVGKIGVNDRGLGLHFNILHHADDGARVGVPVHVAGRHALDTAGDVNQALLALHAAGVSASSCLTLISAESSGAAVCVELTPGGPGHVLPERDGLLLHTNHFLSEPARAGDTEPREAPDTLIRLDLLRRRLHGRDVETADELLSAFACHAAGGGALCCHPDLSLPPEAQYATLATVSLDVAAGTLRALAGGPCAHHPEGATPC